MKKTREYCSPLTAFLLLFLCTCVSAISGGIAAGCIYYVLWLSQTNYSELSELILVCLCACLGLGIGYIMYDAIESILDHKIDNNINCYLDSYAITSAIVLPHQTSSTDFKKAFTTVRMYFEYSYAEIDALYKIMRRTGKVYYVLPAHELPEHLGTIQIAISRRTAKRILGKMSPEQYVILSREVYYNYLGEELLPACSSYISRRDIRRILIHPQWAKTGQVQVCSSIGNFANLRAEILDIWSRQLTKENQYIPTDLEHNSAPKF